MANPYDRLRSKYGLGGSFSAKREEEEEEVERKRIRVSKTAKSSNPYSRLRNKYGLSESGGFIDEQKREEVERGRREFQERQTREEEQKKAEKKEEKKGLFTRAKEKITGLFKKKAPEDAFEFRVGEGLPEETQEFRREALFKKQTPSQKERTKELVKIIGGTGKAIISTPFREESRKEFFNSLKAGGRVLSSNIQNSISILLNKISDVPELTRLKVGKSKEKQKAEKKRRKESVARLRESAQNELRLSENILAQGLQLDDARKFSEKIQDPNFIARGLGLNLPNLIASMGVGIVTTAIAGPQAGLPAAFLTSAGIEGGAAFQEAKDFGVSDEEAEKVAVLVGGINGFLETLPIGDFLTRNPAGKKIKGKIISKIVQNIIRQGTEEGFTESIQEVVSNAVAQTFDENRDLLAGVPESAFFGTLLGSATGPLSLISVSGKAGQKIQKKDVTRFIRVQEEAKADIENNQIDDEKISDIVEQSTEIKTKIDANKENVVNIQDAEGNTNLSIDVLEIEGGKFAVEYSAQTDSEGITIPFDLQETFNTKEKATSKAVADIKIWADEQAEIAEGEDLNQVVDIINNLDDIEAGRVIGEAPVVELEEEGKFIEPTKETPEVTEEIPTKEAQIGINTLNDGRKVEIREIELDKGIFGLSYRFDPFEKFKITQETDPNKLLATLNKEEAPSFERETREGIDRAEQREITGQEAVRNVKEIAKRLKISNLDAEVFDSILDDTGGPAMAVSFGKNIGFEQKVKEFAVEHEFGHSFFRNLEKFETLEKAGVTRESLISEIQAENPNITDQEQLQEKIMENLETYLVNRADGKATTFTGKIKQFFDEVWNFINRIFSGDNRTAIQKFFETIEKGKGKKEVAFREAKAPKAFIKEGKKIISFEKKIRKPRFAKKKIRGFIKKEKTIKTREEKIGKKEERIFGKKQKQEIREAPKFSDQEESQYQQFKKLLSPKELDSIEDADQLKAKIGDASLVDNILNSQTLSDSEMFDKFKDRRFSEIIERGEARVETREIKKESRELGKLKAELKERIAGFETGERTGRILTKQEIKKVQTEIINRLRASNLSLNDKAKFINFIKNTQTESQLAKRTEEINERIARLERLSDARELIAEIKQELKSTKIKRRFKKPKGKFTPETQRMLDTIRGTVGLTRDQAAEKLQANIDRFSETITPIEVAIENRLLDIFSGLEIKSPAKLASILNDIQEIKETGKTLGQLRVFNIASELQAKRDLVVDRVTGGKGVKPGTETTGIVKTRGQKIQSKLKTLGRKMIFSWNGLMDLLEFNNKAGTEVLRNQLGVLDQENKYKELQKDYTDDFESIMSNAYGLKENSFKIQKKIIDLQKEIDLGKFKNAEGNTIQLKMTKDEIIKRYMEFQDPTLRDSFLVGNKFTPEIVNAIADKMTPDDIKLAKAQFKLYKKQWELINPVYSRINGVDLPFNEFYSPIVREGFNVDTSKGLGTFMEDASYRSAITSKSFNTRVKNTLPIARQGSLDVLNRHISETNYFVSWAQKIRELDSIFKDQTVRTAIKQEFTNELLGSIGNQIDDMTNQGNSNARNIPAVDFFRKKFTVGALMIKPILAAKQLVSTLAYLEKINPIDFTIGIADFWRNPIKNWKILNKESTLIATRGANMERDINDALKSDIFKQYSRTRSYMNALMLNIRLGDKGAIVLGSWALRRKRLKQGALLKDVIKEYEEFSADTQQSADISRLSEIQRGGSVEKLFTMFKSSPRQYLAKEISAIRSLFQKGGIGPKNITRVAKVLAIYHVLLPVTFQFLSNLGGWNDDDKKEYKRAALLGSLNGLFIFGDLMDKVLRSALGLRLWDTGTPIDNVVDDVTKAVQKIDFDLITDEDVKEAFSELSGAGNVLGLPVDQVKLIGKGISNIVNKDTKEGLAHLLGYSEYRVAERFGKEEPEDIIPDLIEKGLDDFEIAEEVIEKSGLSEDDEDYDKEFRRYQREALRQKAIIDIGKKAEIVAKKRLNTTKIKILEKFRKDMSVEEFDEMMSSMLYGGIISKNVDNAIYFGSEVEE